MDLIALEEVTADADDRGVERRGLAGPLGTSGLALNHYRVAPDDELPAGLHAHGDQEEVFVVLRGTATFETLVFPPSEDPAADEPNDVVTETLTVESGAAVRFAPGEFQSGRNAGDRDLVVLAIGAPRETDALRFPVRCPDCGHDWMRLATDEDVPRFVCPGCGCERVPTPCPDCGGETLRVRLGKQRRTVVECTDCAATFPSPPTHDGW
ncbi:cupin domain-containing protein [Halomarina rubra]|uniref:Cupin n=1 Tax=Halomarina rubra TaxID=2071873 RepID=A0ABD6AX85_9EURY|nr:cupin domain-containing protein [Halomarina rubra]